MADTDTQWAATLADNYGRMVFTTAFRILGAAVPADDTLQNVFLKVLRLSPKKRKRVLNWGAYLRVLAVNDALDQLRSKHVSSTDNEIELPAPRGESPYQQLNQQQIAQRLRQLLKQIPNTNASIFALRYFEELSYEEIGAAMGLSPNQVGVGLHRARKQLARIGSESIIGGRNDPQGARS